MSENLISNSVVYKIVTELSKPEKILLVADVLTIAGKTPFHVATLTREVWQVYPDTFGLHGYETKHPDNNTVISAVVGKRGMAGRGWLRKVKPNIYEVTALGRECVKAIQAGRHKEAKMAHNTHINGIPKDELFLDGLIRTAAHSLDLLDNRLAITCGDAREFFGNQSVEELRRSLSTIAESDSSQANVAKVLRHLADYLGTRFAKQLEIQKEKK